MTNVNEVLAALLAALPTGTMSELVLAQVDRAAELTVLAAQLPPLPARSYGQFASQTPGTNGSKCNSSICSALFTRSAANSYERCGAYSGKRPSCGSSTGCPR